MDKFTRAAKLARVREEMAHEARAVAVLTERRESKALLDALAAKLRQQPLGGLLPGTRRLGPQGRSLARRIEAQRQRGSDGR